ncbi:MAG: hypothetical protein H0T76_18680 [Nannocystis sp.]|nr:hypothetical protein [Nannocystis sp.]MBA3548513.1 hypothetical protein [Nannocystis sp.]
MSYRSEQVEVLASVGCGLITLARGGLIVGGMPVAHAWDDRQGSIGQYLLRLPFDRTEIERRLRQIEWFVANGIPEYQSLASVFEPIAPLFAPGTYQLTFPIERDGVWDLIDWNERRGDEPYREEFYPYGLQLIATQPRVRLDAERIEHWSRAIAKGARPIVIAVRAANAPSFHFILDGHHKAEAYLAHRIHPAVLELETELGPELSESERAALTARSRPAPARAARRRPRR